MCIDSLCYYTVVNNDSMTFVCSSAVRAGSRQGASKGGSYRRRLRLARPGSLGPRPLRSHLQDPCSDPRRRHRQVRREATPGRQHQRQGNTGNFGLGTRNAESSGKSVR